MSRFASGSLEGSKFESSGKLSLRYIFFAPGDQLIFFRDNMYQNISMLLIDQLLNQSIFSHADEPCILSTDLLLSRRMKTPTNLKLEATRLGRSLILK